MIVRKYGRRDKAETKSYSTAESFSDVVSDSPSHSQDVYDFTFSSQGSGHCHWSDPYSFTSSQESRQLPILPARKSGVLEKDFRNTKKLKMIDVDSETSDCNLSQQSKEFGDLTIYSDAGIKKFNHDPYEYNSEEELEEVSVCPSRKGREKSDSVVEISEGEFGKSSKLKSTEPDSYGLNSSQDLDELGISQDCWEINGVSPQKKNKNKRELGDAVFATTTLMETREFGEMREHLDEMNYALDGLKKGQQVRVRRASLLSLLSMCGTVQQRRTLRVLGRAKTIVDAVLGLNFDDQPSNIAAAALLYILASDGQDDHLLDSPSCIQVLIKLLKPLTSNAAKEKEPTIGSKLLSMCKNVGFSQNSVTGTDSSVTDVTLKVQEILINCKEMKPRSDCCNRTNEPEINPKWISLLTMEKACLSTISIEDSAGTLRKTRGDFKEKFRLSGGLDAVFEVARECHSAMEEWLKKCPHFATDSEEGLGLESLVVVLKCLKIMENATFLSKDNQCHLLGMKGKFGGHQAPRSFIRLILSVIKILSGVFLLRGSLGSSKDEMMPGRGCCSMECTASQKSSDVSQCNECLISSQTGSFKSSLEPSQVSADPLLLKMRVESSAAGASTNSDYVIHISSDSSELEFSEKKQQISTNAQAKEYIQDPFAFDGDDFEPSKWELLSGMVKKYPSKDNRATLIENKNDNHSVLGLSQQESNSKEDHLCQETSCSSTADEEKSNLIADCLVTAVKVLMNLTNDNPEGCQQLASCGGLEILSSLIAGHFPSFTSSLPHFFDVRASKSSPRIVQQSNPRLADQELDFLVVILGLLVNLVEKDGRNRSRLAAASVSVPIKVEGLGLTLKDERDVISLLCSIFLANQGAGEATGEGKPLSWEDEDSILQGQKEAEKMIVEAYAALLLAFLSTESMSTRDAISECLPKQNLSTLVPVLERFVEFHMTLNMISPETHKAVVEVIETCKIP